MKEISGLPHPRTGHSRGVEIDRSVMPITEAAAGFGHAAPHQPGFPEKNKRERVMIETMAFAVVSLALGIPALIGATMLGSRLNLD
jgi:hypothetical protein